jgi:hypothetical protein
MELIFEIRDVVEGGFHARALGHGIFTEGESWEELRQLRRSQKRSEDLKVRER